MVTDEQAEKAADWLRDNAGEAARLRGERIKAEEMRKHVKAVLMGQSDAKSAADREAAAYASEAYRKHLDVIEGAVVADEKNRALREAAVMRIEVWRTECSNQRGRI